MRHSARIVDLIEVINTQLLGRIDEPEDSVNGTATWNALDRLANWIDDKGGLRVA